MLPSNEELTALLRNWDNDYVVRNAKRISKNGEVFTPTALVREILSQLPPELFSDSTETFLDPCCGNGQFLSEVIIWKLQNGSSFKEALKTTYGVDIMLDNVDVCRERILCGVEEYRYIVERNIVCADALTFNFEYPDFEDE